MGLASVIISAQWWSYGGIYFQSMQNKWGGFMCHVRLGYKKQNKGRNFIMLRNIPVSLETKYTLSSATIKQMPGKYCKQSITAPGCSRSHTDGNAHVAWTGASTKSLGAPQSIQQSKPHLGSSLTQKLHSQAHPMGQKGLFYISELFGGIFAGCIT